MQQDYILEFFEMQDSRIQVWESCLKNRTNSQDRKTFFVNGPRMLEPVIRFLDSESIRRYR